MTRVLRLLILFAAPLAGACNSDSGDPPQVGSLERHAPAAMLDSGSAADVVVTGRLRQRIQGWGASVVASSLNDPLVDPGGMAASDLRALDRRIFDEARINLVRVFAPGYGLDTEALPLQPGDARLAFMRRVRGRGVRFMLTGADAPTALKDGSRLKPGAEASYARYLADVLSVARRAGVPFSFVAVTNEPDNENALVQLNPEQMARTYDALRRLVRERGLRARLVLGDNTGWDQTLRYATSGLQSDRLVGASAAIASHGYFGSQSDRRALARLARGAGLPVWQTEWGAGCPDCGDQDTIGSAMPWALKIVEGITQAHATAWFTFRAIADSGHGPQDALLVRTRKESRPFYASKRYHVFRQYSTAAPPGARRLVVRAPAGVTAVAFRYRGSVRLVMANHSGSVLRVRASLGRGGGLVRTRRTSASESFAALPSRRYRDRIVVELPPSSVTTLFRS